VKEHPLQSPRGRRLGSAWKPSDEELRNLSEAVFFLMTHPKLRLLVHFQGGPGSVATLSVTLNKLGAYKPARLRYVKRGVGNNCIEVSLP
jgi:hypothetical protein